MHPFILILVACSASATQSPEACVPPAAPIAMSTTEFGDKTACEVALGEAGRLGLKGSCVRRNLPYSWPTPRDGQP